jgi:chromosomal replication initiation ATPase DnaA
MNIDYIKHAKDVKKRLHQAGIDAQHRMEREKRQRNIEASRKLARIIEAQLDKLMAFRAAAQENKPNWLIIADEVAAKHKMTREVLFSKSRKSYVVFARQEACYRLCEELGFSLSETGKKMGGLDHTTVLHARRSHAKRVQENAS